MAVKSSEDRYGTVAITIHWASALGILAALGTGLVAADMADPAVHTTLIRGHAVLGTLVLVLTVLRILWWVLADRHPLPVTGMPGWQARAASILHGLLYVVILIMAASGIATLLLSNAIPALIAGTALPEFSEIPPRLAHGLLSRLMLALLAGHIGAALYHHFIRRDRLLGRMGLGPA